jgi:hypothetical protein
MSHTDPEPEPEAPGVSEHLAPKTQDADEQTSPPVEYGGPSGPEPTRYGDWERKGRCIDF